MSSPLALLKSFVLILALVVLPMALFGLCCTVTWQGRLLSVSGGMLGLGPLLWCIGHERESQFQERLGKIMLLAGIGGFALVDLRAPDGHTAESARIHARYSTNSGRPIRWSVGRLLPEIDQIHLGYAAAVAFDPLFTQQQRTDLSAMTDSMYAEMAADADFTAVGSALSSIYREICFEEFRDGHYFHYIPANVDRSKPTPALVFLHGSGGNFKAYIWLLSKMADELGITIIAPSFGLGNWEKRGGYETITRAIADAGKHAAIDPDHIHLMGLSNGGKGLCLAETAAGPKFHSLIFLSAVWHDRIRPRELAARLQQRRILILSGGSDRIRADRMLPSYTPRVPGPSTGKALPVVYGYGVSESQLIEWAEKRWRKQAGGVRGKLRTMRERQIMLARQFQPAQPKTGLPTSARQTSPPVG